MNFSGFRPQATSISPILKPGLKPAEDYTELKMDLNKELVKNPSCQFRARVQTGHGDSSRSTCQNATQPDGKICWKFNYHQMRHILSFLAAFLFYGYLLADIAPNPIVIKGIYTPDSCEVQMVSEFVFADIYNDSARVECTFEMLNHGKSQTIQVGFPEMNFQYWSMGPYNENDRAVFQITVDGRVLTGNDIKVPEKLEDVYGEFMQIYSVEKEFRRKFDSIIVANRVIIKNNGNYRYPSEAASRSANHALENLYAWRSSHPFIGSEFELWKKYDSLKVEGDFPWYVWNVHFEKNETKTIKVVYSLPSGMGYGGQYRYFKYILETGAGWHKAIEEAEIKLQFHDIVMSNIEKISPVGGLIDYKEKTISWMLENIKPTAEDDIYVQYFNPKERRQWRAYQNRRKRAMTFRKWRIFK